MKVTINIPTEEVADMIDFLAEVYNYQPKIYDPNDTEVEIDNPETRINFAKRHLMKPLKEGFDGWLIRRAIAAADPTSNITVDSVV